LMELRGEIAKRTQVDPDRVPFILIPGNHDCNFGTERGVRRQLLQQSGIELAGAASQEGSIVDELTSIQKDFYDLMERVSPPRTARSQYSRLAWSIQVQSREK